MRKEFVVKSIDAAPDGAPYVIVSLSSMDEVRDGGHASPQMSGSKIMGFTNMNDMMEDINKMLSGMRGNSLGAVTSIKLDMHEYKQMGLSVGDKVYVDMTRAESLGV